MAATKDNDKLRMTPIVEEKEYDSVSWGLLEDHPLRSYPTECFPGLLSCIVGYFAALRKRWAERVFSLICLFLMFLMVIQFLATLPYGLTYILFRRGVAEPNEFVPWTAEFKGQQSTCILYNAPAHDPVQYAVNAGCSGVTVDIRVQKDLLQDSAITKALNTLRDLYLNPLVGKLDAQRSAEALQASLSEFGRVGLFDEEPTRSFTLVLKLHPLVELVLPQLAFLLEPLKEKGYLSFRNGTRFVARHVTVVLTGRDMADSGDVSGSDWDGTLNSIMLDTSLDELGGDYGPVSSAFETSRTENDDSIQSDGAPGNSPNYHQVSSYQMLTATSNFSKSIDFSHRGGRFSQQQIERVRAQVRAAHRRGLRARYEGISFYSQPLQRMIWRILVHEGADLIEVDGTRCELPWWRRFFMAGGMQCHGRTRDNSEES